MSGVTSVELERAVEGGRQGAHVVEMQHHRLLLAIGEVVAEEGLEQASVARVCKRAGVSRRTFYDLFEDSEACLLEAFEQAVASIAEDVRRAYEGEQKWSARIRAGLSVLLGVLDSNRSVAWLCVVEAPRAGMKIAESRRRVLDVLIAAIDEGRCESKQGGALSPVAAQGIVGGCLAVIQASLMERDHGPLVELVNPLMGMIVQPYLGAQAAKRELQAPTPTPTFAAADGGVKDPFKGLSIRFTYRTARVLATIATYPGTSNRMIADSSGIADEGQMSRLLSRLQSSGLIENKVGGPPKGEPNAWRLTGRGKAIHAALGMRSG
jgi:AcrR family transcriptional regulator